MTKPNNEFGVSVAFKEQIRQNMEKSRKRSCEWKKRYADEFSCRAAGIGHMEEKSIQLYLYKCQHCRGWHLTKNERPPYFAADYLLKSAYK